MSEMENDEWSHKLAQAELRAEQAENRVKELEVMTDGCCDPTQGNGTWCYVTDKRVSELQRLEAQLEELKAQHEEDKIWWMKKAEELKTQNARLKEALKHIAAGTYSSFPIEYKDLCKFMMTIADNALHQGDGKSRPKKQESFCACGEEEVDGKCPLEPESRQSDKEEK
jgi:hypothetical protein